MNTLNPQDILEKIKKDDIRPRAKWFFVLEHAVLWIPGAIVTLVGGVAVAGMFYSGFNSGWEYREFTHDSLLNFFIDAVPFVWIISFGLFSSLIVRALRTTHSGYRLSAGRILLSSVTASILLGGLIYLADDTYKADSFIRYSVHTREKAIWDTPTQGRLLGVVEKIENKMISVKDQKGEVWSVDISQASTTTLPFVKIGEPIRIVGTTTEDDDFVACRVFPWGIGGVEVPNQKRNNKINIMPKQKVSTDCEEVLKTSKHFNRERN